MKMILMLIIALGVGGAIYYFTFAGQKGTATHFGTMEQSAQQKADIYKKNQEDMMKQIQQ